MPGTALTLGTAKNLDQFRDLLALVCLVARRDGMFHAVTDMVAQYFVLDAIERRFHRIDLGDDVDAIAVFLQHFGNAAYLAFDAGEPFLAGCLAVRVHGAYIPP